MAQLSRGRPLHFELPIWGLRFFRSSSAIPSGKPLTRESIFFRLNPPPNIAPDRSLFWPIDPLMTSSKPLDSVNSFIDFPEKIWDSSLLAPLRSASNREASLRTTNPIESTFATVRHRTRQTKGCGSRVTTLTMVFKLAIEAKKHWRRLNSYSLITRSKRPPEMIGNHGHRIDGGHHVTTTSEGGAEHCVSHPGGRAGWWKSPCPDLARASVGLPTGATQPISRKPGGKYCRKRSASSLPSIRCTSRSG